MAESHQWASEFLDGARNHTESNISVSSDYQCAGTPMHPRRTREKAEFTKTIPQFTEKVTKFLSYLEFELKPERIHLTHQL